MSKKYLFIAAWLLLALTLAGCSSDGGPTTASNSYPILGRVTLNEPVKSATLRITDSNNKLLYEKLNLPMRKGSRFLLEDVPSLPTDVRFSVDQIVLDSGPFNGTLSARYPNFKPSLHVIDIHAVTTLIDRYQQRHSGDILTKIHDKVQSCLSIGAGVDLYYGVNHTNKFFDHAAFSAAVAKNGGFDAFIQSQITSIEAGTACAYASKKVAAKASPLAAEGDIMDAVGSKLLDQALNVGTDDATGWVLSLIGGGDSGSSVESMLKAQTQMLQQIEDELQTLSNQVAEVQKELDLTAYQTNVEILQSTVSQVNSAYLQLTWYSEEKPGSLNLLQQNYLVNFISNIQENLGASLDTLNADLVGTAGTVGLIQLWIKTVMNGARWDAQNYPQRKAMLDYYKAVQLKAALILVETIHASGLDQGAQYYAQEYQTNITTQYQFLPAFPPAGIIDLQSGLMWQQAAPPFELNKDWQSAKNYCSQLSIGNHTDWRMPTYHELTTFNGDNDWEMRGTGCQSLMWETIFPLSGFDLSNMKASASSATGGFCSNNKSVWTSDQADTQFGKLPLVYVLDNGVGDLANSNSSTDSRGYFNTWCVRGKATN